MQETKLILVRHAATDWNLRRPYILQGRKLNPPLAEIGVRQAVALANELSKSRIDAIYSSPLERAVATAGEIAKVAGVDVTTLEAITEADIGLWEGKTWSEVAIGWPDEAAAFERDASLYGYAGGENLTQVRDRSIPAIESMLERHQGGTVVVVGHNVVNRSVLGHWLRLPLAASRKLPQANGGFNLISFCQGVCKVQTINIVHHLDGLLPRD